MFDKVALATYRHSLFVMRRASTRKKEHVNSPLGLHQGQNAWWEPLAQVVEMGDSRGSRSAHGEAARPEVRLSITLTSVFCVFCDF